MAQFFNSLGRSMTKSQPRPPKRSATTNSNLSSNNGLHAEVSMPASPSSPSLASPGLSLPTSARPRTRSDAGRSRNGSDPRGESGRRVDTAPLPLYLSQPFVKAALVKGNFKTIVMLPKWVDVNEWVAINIFDFYNNLNLFYGVLAETCTLQKCPTMAAGNTLDYTWIDANRKQVKLPAPTYIDYVFTWVQNLLEDKMVFPTNNGRPFPQSFASTAKHIYRQLLRVFAHIYHSHYVHLLHLQSEPHFNSLFAHFLAFGKEYGLLDAKDIKGHPDHQVGVGDLWDKWKEMGILEG